MSLTAKLSIGWLCFVTIGAVYAQLDAALSDPTVPEPHKGLPLLQDAYYQGLIWGTSERLESPSLDHWLGTDGLGRDFFARLIAGGWPMLQVVCIALAVAIPVGVGLGLVAGWLDRPLRGLFEWFLDSIEAFPQLLLLLVAVSVAAGRSVLLLGVLIGIAIVPGITRTIRRPAVVAGGTASSQLGPRVLGIGLASAAVAVSMDLLVSFLGFGLQLPTPTWGSLINEGRVDIGTTIRPILMPGLWVILTIAALQSLAGTVAEGLDERQPAPPVMPPPAAVPPVPAPPVMASQPTGADTGQINPA